MKILDRWSGHSISTLTTAEVLKERAAKFGDKIFLHYLPDNRKFSYRDIDIKSNQLTVQYLL